MSAPAGQDHGGAEPLLVLVRWHGACATVTLHGELDLATAPLLTGCLTSVLAQQPRQLTVDLARLDFIDCAGIAPLVRARHLLPPGRPLIIRSPTAPARRLLRLTGLGEAWRAEAGNAASAGKARETGPRRRGRGTRAARLADS